MTARKPTHHLCMLNKKTNEKGRVGAGWSNPDGSIAVVLNPSVVLSQSSDVILTLFPQKDSY